MGEESRHLLEPARGAGGGLAEGTDAADPRQTATLIYNEKAGGGGPSAPELLDLLEETGIGAVHRPTERAEDLDDALDHDEGLVVVAGGDGTFREVARRLAGRGRPAAIIPMGTANNSARTLGVEGPPGRVIRGLAEPDVVKLDLARAKGPWGDEVLLEGAGLGVFANILSAYRPEEGKNLLRALGAAADNLGAERPVRCRIQRDGELLEDEYLLVEMMNMRTIGPRLNMAPQADPTDGLLELVLVRYENREALLTYLTSLLRGELEDLPSVETTSFRELRVHWRSSAFHLDDQVLCEEARESNGKAFSAHVKVMPGALELWRPRLAEQRAQNGV